MKKKEVNINTMIALKARLGFNGDIEKLINTAVEKLEVSLPENKTPCTFCGSEGTLEVTTGDFNFISGAVVKNIPVWKCKKCGEIEYSLRLFAEIEEAINGATGEIDFNDLLKPN